MRRILFFIAFVLPIWLSAEPIDVETARQTAANFLRHQPSLKGKRMIPANKPLNLLYTQRQTTDEAPTLYVFGNGDHEGFVVIAGDDAAITPVLGYSSTGTFDADSIPCCLRFLYEEYGRQLAYARKHPSSGMEPNKLNASRETIQPLITSKWHQHEPFNNLCPIDPETGERCPTGCAATAIAQILYYHKWPEQGVGSYSYEWNGQTLTADFGSTTYHWDKMKDQYDGADDDPDNAVATLMYHCGVAMNTDYNSSYGSAVNINWGLVSFLSQNLNYSKAAVLAQGDNTEDFDNTIYKELSAKHPVCLMGGSHAFVCDGYENGYYHFNFGWGGSSDDYYLLSAITPGSGYYNFSGFTTIVYGIRKAEKEYTEDDVFYELFPDGTAHLVKGYTGYDYVVPSIIETDGQSYEVTTIEDEAFRGSLIPSITIPNSVTYIGHRAFRDCQCLTSVSIPSSVTFIGDEVFRFCHCLETIHIEDGNPIYDSRDNCNAVIETASNTLLMGCKNTIIPNGVTSIADYAFQEMTELTSMTIPDGVTSIGDWAFFCCDNLSSITISNSVTHIGKRAFEGCNILKSVTLPTGITSLSENLFTYCFNLTSITIPNSVTTINDAAFFGCPLSSIIIPSSVTYIGEAVFCGGTLTSIQVESGNPKYDSRDNCNAIIETASNTLITGCKKTIIPNSVTTIYDSSFRDCGAMTSITIPPSVTDILWCAFSNCYSLTDVYCQGNVPETDYFAFFDTPVENATLHVPAELLEAYKTTEPWSGFGKIVALSDVMIGDVNGDGSLSVTDVGMIISYILQTNPEGFNKDAADMNGDGDITVTDVGALITKILTGE